MPGCSKCHFLPNFLLLNEWSQDVFNLLPNLNVNELIKAFSVKTNDMMLVIYLSSLIRSVIALHNLINNKVLLSRHTVIDNLQMWLIRDKSIFFWFMSDAQQRTRESWRCEAYANSCSSRKLSCWAFLWMFLGHFLQLSASWQLHFAPKLAAANWCWLLWEFCIELYFRNYPHAACHQNQHPSVSMTSWF